MTFYDFEAIKEAFPVEKVITLLGLDMKEKAGQHRGPCPACKSGGDRALAINSTKRSYYCFADGKGGDVISLTAHIKGITVKEAAEWLQDSSSTAPPTKVKETQKLQTLAHMEHDHPAVEAIGLDTAVAQRLGIGFRTKGAGQGSVLIPVRNESGEVEGWLGVQELTYIPKDFAPPENVVKFPKKA